MNKAAIGARGEEYLCEHLKNRGYTILARNYHSRYGEIDIIAEQGERLCFVEVKTRKQNSLVAGEYAVSKSKQRKIIMTALHYLQETPSEWELRFDVAVLTHDQEGHIIHCEYYPAAFDSSAYSR